MKFQDKQIYCVYVHIRKDTGKVFYVGKGWPHRPKSLTNRNPHWKNVVAKAGYEVKILKEKLTNDQASAIEIRLISLYRSRRPGSLVNITNGGDGVPGLKHTPEARHKMSIAKKGKSLPAPPGRGLAISLAKQNKPTKLSKQVLCINDGQIFQSAAIAAKYYGINRQNLGKLLAGKGTGKTLAGKTFKWL